MRIEVLDDAKDDLVDGFHFYEEQSAGSVPISSIPFSPTSIRCFSTPAFTASSMARTDVSPTGFLSRSTIASRQISFVSAPSLIVAAIRHGFDGGYNAKAPNQLRLRIDVGGKAGGASILSRVASFDELRTTALRQAQDNRKPG